MQHIKKEIAKRTLAQNSLYHFILLKWERYNCAAFMENWHIELVAKVLESTIPSNPLTDNSGRMDCHESANADSRKTNEVSFFSNDNGLPRSLHSLAMTKDQAEVSCDFAKELGKSKRRDVGGNSFVLQGERGKTNDPQAEVFCDDFLGCEVASEETQRRSILKESLEIKAQDIGGNFGVFQGERGDKTGLSIAQANRRNPQNLPNSQAEPTLITRLMLNMPPSYGKTEIIARSFIAWALGRDRSRKFIYISYSDDLCRKIANQVRDLIKSDFWVSVFGARAEFLQDNAQEFVFKQGGGLFVTTLKSAITGFHAHQILIDDPIKVSEMSSKAARDAVNQNFKESVLSRLQDNKSNITILMQRLSDNDLCGFLLDEKEFEPQIIKEWKVLRLQALNEKQETYTIGDFSYTRQENEPLFPQRHSKKELENLRLQMGNDEFSTQYLQEPLVTSGGYFDTQYYTNIFTHELGAHTSYIFVDNAMSLKASADNRAIVVVAAESYQNTTRYVLQDCFFGIWSEEQTISHIIEAMGLYKKANVFIESDGGGLVLHRLLQDALSKHNTLAKTQGREMLTQSTQCYTPSRKISKVDKIKALRPFYNTGYLVFLHSARGQEQIKRELFSFNPDKPFRKDDCIDALSSAITHESVHAPSANSQKPRQSERERRYFMRQERPYRFY